MAGSVHLMSISQANGLTLKGISIHSMVGVLECQWIKEQAKLGKKKLGTRTRKLIFPTPQQLLLIRILVLSGQYNQIRDLEVVT
jgi:hypothetical protein